MTTELTEPMVVERVRTLFGHVLERDAVQANDDFFSLGGGSLLATRVLAKIFRQFGVELTFADFVETPSPMGLAGKILRRAQL